MDKVNLTQICNDSGGRVLVQVDLRFNGSFSPEQLQERARETLRGCFQVRLEDIELEPYVGVNGNEAVISAYVKPDQSFHNLLKGIKIGETSIDRVERVCFKVEQKAPEHYNPDTIAKLFDIEMRSKYNDRFLGSQLANVKGVRDKDGKLISFEYFVYLKI